MTPSPIPPRWVSDPFPSVTTSTDLGAAAAVVDATAARVGTVGSDVGPGPAESPVIGPILGLARPIRNACRSSEADGRQPT